jgi:hypothetical protein
MNEKTQNTEKETEKLPSNPNDMTVFENARAAAEQFRAGAFGHVDEAAERNWAAQMFQYNHLPDHLQAISKPFGDLALQIIDTLPPNVERTAALRSLLQSKDAAVRAMLLK